MSSDDRPYKRICIRRANEFDAESIWAIFCEVVEEGDAFLADESTTRDVALHMWLGSGIATFIAQKDDGAIVGSYCLKPNHHGRGSHVANATYMVRRECRGRGIGRLLGEHSLRTAKEAGYDALQFNCVVSTNEASIALWKKLGFSVVGTLPQAYRHATLGLVDAHVMYKRL